jgi:uncharacterized protein (TIGR02246 family)
MTRHIVLIVLLAAAAAPAAAQETRPADIIALEQGALDRWAKGDPDGYYAIMAEDITYFDPRTQKRMDGLAALRKMFEPFRGTFTIDRVELVNPEVRIHGDVAILATNIISRGAQAKGTPKRDVPWNVTEVYRRINGRWRIVHSHFSYTTPKLAE